MGFLKTGDTEMQVYLTDFGKNQMLAQTFTPSYFTINDADVNYLTNQIMSKSAADVSGDYDNNVFSMSKWRNIQTAVIRRLVTPTPVSTSVTATTTLAATA